MKNKMLKRKDGKSILFPVPEVQKRTPDFVKYDGLIAPTGLFTNEGIEQLEVNAEKMRKASKKVNANYIVAEYYKRYCEEFGFDIKKSFNIANCFRMFDIDYYRLQAVKVIKRVNLCHDKFCVNCQNQLSEHRYSKYKPVLDEYLKDYAIYHVVLTVPNCLQSSLKTTLDRMYAKFAYMIRYFQMTKGKRDFGDFFARFGFVGCIRNLEIGVKQKGFLTEMHPHFHCLFLVKKGFDNTGYHINTFSFSKSHFPRDRKVDNGKRFFSDFEIFLQKLWYLIYNGIKVSQKSIDELELGYSCYAQRVFSDYKEVFKYTMKGMFDEKTSQFGYSEETFRYLLEALHRRKIIQGYGLLNKFSFLDKDDEAELDDYFNQRIIALRQIEDPYVQFLKLEELIKEMAENKHIKYISKNSLKAKVDARAGGKQ